MDEQDKIYFWMVAITCAALLLGSGFAYATKKDFADYDAKSVQF